MQDPRGEGPPPLHPGETVVSPHCVRIVAPNPSPMTLDGTNTYLIVGEGGRAVIVDPGPEIASHEALILRALDSRGLRAHSVITTHSHLDHSALAPALAGDLGVDYVPTRAALEVDWHQEGIDFRALATPGHSRDHVAFLLGEGTLLSGDHILGRGTTAILYPDGSLGDYFSSLDRVEECQMTCLGPGHGPRWDGEMAKRIVAYYRSHRIERIEQVVSLMSGDRVISEEELASRIYEQYADAVVAVAARMSLRATLAYLSDEGVVIKDVGGYRAK